MSTKTSNNFFSFQYQIRVQNINHLEAMPVCPSLTVIHSQLHGVFLRFFQSFVLFLKMIYITENFAQVLLGLLP